MLVAEHCVYLDSFRVLLAADKYFYHDVGVIEALEWHFKNTLKAIRPAMRNDLN